MASLGRHLFEDDPRAIPPVLQRDFRWSGSWASRAVLGVVLALIWSQSSCKEHGTSGPKAETMTRLDAMRGCLSSDACGVFAYAHLQHCVSSRYDSAFRASLAAVWAQIFDCVADAGGDCEQVRRCYSGGQGPSSCSDVTEGFCDGDVQVTCDVIDGKLYRLDCGLAAQQCSMATMPSGDQVPVCGYGTCDQEEFGAQCRGNLRLLCDSGYVGVRDCTQDGKVCVGGECVASQFACASHPFCDGQVLYRCDDGSKVSTDCAALPGHMLCDDQAGACVEVLSPCQDGQESCEGTVARLCHNGIWLRVDCQELGFAGCGVTDGGVHCTR